MIKYRQVTCCTQCHSIQHLGAFSAIMNGFSYDKAIIMCQSCGEITKYYDQKQQRMKSSILKPSTWFKEQWVNV